MRKIAFVTSPDKENIKKVMIYESNNGIYLFGYDTVFDYSSLFDEWYENLESAEMCCMEEYNVKSEDWILISDPQEFCQHDLIMPIRVKGRERGMPQWGNYEIFSNGKWTDYNLELDKSQLLTAMTGNERLFATGLWNEFERERKSNKTKARKMLEVLQFDIKSIEEIL